jgi:hypothetical protein
LLIILQIGINKKSIYISVWISLHKQPLLIKLRYLNLRLVLQFHLIGEIQTELVLLKIKKVVAVVGHFLRLQFSNLNYLLIQNNHMIFLNNMY